MWLIGNKYASHVARRTSHVKINNWLALSRHKFPSILLKKRLLPGGFTLIELLISMAILGVWLVVIIQSYMTSVNGLNISQNYIQAISIANEKLGEFQEKSQVTKGLAPLGYEFGKKTAAGKEFNWSCNINEINLPKYLNKELVEVCVKVEWNERGAVKNFALATYLPRVKEKEQEQGK
jgi:type II secretion system protein I